jgi:hypothetical protein
MLKIGRNYKNLVRLECKLIGGNEEYRTFHKGEVFLVVDYYNSSSEEEFQYNFEHIFTCFVNNKMVTMSFFMTENIDCYFEEII